MQHFVCLRHLAMVHARVGTCTTTSRNFSAHVQRRTFNEPPHRRIRYVCVQDIETGTKRFEVAYEQLLAWKQPLCMRICHTFAKFGINVMDSDVDWDSKDAQHWLSLLPNGY